MDFQPQAGPEPGPAPELRPDFLAEPGPAPRDPLAVAVGNASLLGVGYLLLRKRALAVLTWLVTLTLVIMLASVREVWVELITLAWWLLSIAHGWSLATKRGARTVLNGQRIAASVVAVVVLVTVVALRFDAASIEGSVTEARDNGDCLPALAALDKVSLGHRIADGPLTVRGERTVEACQRLQYASGRLTAGLTGQNPALQDGFDSLASILAELPGHEKMVGKTLDGFLAGLPADGPCQTAAVTDWLRKRPAAHNVLDRAADAIGRTEPAALLGCADDLVAAEKPELARARYQDYLDRYPGQELKPKAEEGVRKATLALELKNVRSLLSGAYGTSQPSYCDKPAQYSGAPSYAKGPNRVLMYGDTEYTANLPAEWRASGPEDAALIVCVGKAEYGTPVRTCPYTSAGSVRGFPTSVTFKKIVIPIRAYELRTGKLVSDTRPEIGGTSCPQTIHFTTYGLSVSLGPPSEMHVTPSDADLRAAFAAVVSP